ncbi:serine/threonine-protein kinase roco4 [Mizuhopecten yessoensis]|uniref:Serine/threonine-protein kinase roco4 n=2 Tax=Mizuhopecten yessoensis TaxID=6573 RepID=A0A210R3K0_MIZYE|nr:serine/threonine-protein kinase roco4 [Mizuhopecten yessoensis]
METPEIEAGFLTGSQDGLDGDSLSGDTAAVKRALVESFQVKRASLRAKSDGAFLSLWDMGGHTSFQASHNVFLSSHGVYLLVFRLTDFLKDKLETDRLKKWIRLIGTFSSGELNAPRIKQHDPPLIFVGTFLDELKRTTLDYDKRVQAMQSNIAKFPELSAHKFVRFCTADNSLGNDDTELEVLRGFIIEAAVHQDQWDREIPARWVKLEMDLLEARKKGTRILKFAEVIEMNKRSVAPLPDEDEMKLALE